MTAHHVHRYDHRNRCGCGQRDWEVAWLMLGEALGRVRYIAANGWPTETVAGRTTSIDGHRVEAGAQSWLRHAAVRLRRIHAHPAPAPAPDWLAEWRTVALVCLHHGDHEPLEPGFVSRSDEVAWHVDCLFSSTMRFLDRRELAHAEPDYDYDETYSRTVQA